MAIDAETAAALKREFGYVAHEDRKRPAPIIPASEWMKTGNLG